MVDIKRRENDMPEAIGRFRDRRDMTLMQITLNEFAYPELQAVWDDLRTCLEGPDGRA